MTLCHVTENTARYGGGLHIDLSATVVMTLCHVSGNTASIGGGGGVRLYFGDLHLTGCTISSNTASGGLGFGGGVYVFSSGLHLTECTLSSNTAATGGAVYVSAGDITMTSSFVSNNTALDGGGLYIDSGDVTCMDVTLIANTASQHPVYTDGTRDLYENIVIYTDPGRGGGAVNNVGVGTFNAYGTTVMNNNRQGEEFNAIGGYGAKCSFCASSCPAGEYGSCSPAIGAPGCSIECSCTKCFAGTSLAEAGSTLSSDCELCTAGTTSSAGAPACSACAAGKYASNSEGDDSGGLATQVLLGATSCNSCPAGYRSAGAAVVCLACSAGTSSSPGDESCTSCGVGQYSTGGSACLPCAPGKFVAVNGSVNCASCLSGKHAPVYGASACDECLAGSYSSEGASMCIHCLEGSFNTNNGLSSCEACAAGSVAPNISSMECAPCAIGKFQGGTGQSTCLDCDKGKAVAANGSTSCTSCSSGKHTLSSGMNVCNACPAGTFSGPQASECQQCTPGYYSSAAASSACSECPRGYSSSEGFSTCSGQAEKGYFLFKPSSSPGVATECPKHSSCEGGTFMPRPERDYWVDRRSLEFSDTIFKCPRETCVSQTSAHPQRRLASGFDGEDRSCWDIAAYSDGGFDDDACNSDHLLCQKGSRGALCGSCEESYVYSSAERVCIACDKSQMSALVLGGTAAGVALVTGSLYCSGALQRLLGWVARSHVLGMLRQIDSGAIRVAWANYQIVQSVTWSLDVNFPPPFKQMLSVLSVFSFDFISFECFFEQSNHFTSVYLWSLTPVVLALVLIFVHLARARCAGSTITKADLTYQLLLLGYLVLPPVSLKQLQALDCVGVAGKSYVRIDTSVDCESSEFRTFRVVDALFIITYLSIPLTWLAFLLVRRESLNPAPTTGSDKKFALFLRDQDQDLRPLKFLFGAYRPSFFYLEVVEMYRRVLFIGLLPLLSASYDRRATLGVLFAVLSLAFYNETKPFQSKSTNALAVVAQYTVLMTFGAALVIEVDIARGIEPLVLGVNLTAINMAIVALLLYSNTGRYLRKRREQDCKEARQAQRVEWAAGFDMEKFKTTLDKVEKECVPTTHALVYQYCSLSDANTAIRSGIPALASDDMPGVVVTLHRPHELDKIDKATFTIREAVLACVVPWNLLKPYQNTWLVGGGESQSLPPALCVIPVEVLTALRGSHFESLLDPQPWFQGGVLLPPHQIVRAYRLTEGGNEETSLVANAASRPVCDQSFANCLAANAGVDRKQTRSRSSTFGGFLGSQSFASSLFTRTSADHTHAEIPATWLQFTDKMTPIRAECKANGLEIVYHYTKQNNFALILKTGFRMSTQGQGDGGVYFSTLGPAAYALGGGSYEENIIVDCFGAGRLGEYKGKGMLDLCLVYGAEPAILSQAPGGRDNAKMATKALFQGFALSDKDGNYFLRPDRLFGVFLLPASEQPVGYAEAKGALAAERAADAATKERLSAVQRAMEASGDELRALHLELHGEKETGADEPTVSAAAAPADGGDDRDIELASSSSGDGGGVGDIVYSGLSFTSPSFDVENTATLWGFGDESSDEENK